MTKCIQELEFLEQQLSGSTSDVVFCHNDLLCANILYQAPSHEDAEVKQKAKVRFIDYEYGNYNWRAYVSLCREVVISAHAYPDRPLV